MTTNKLPLTLGLEKINKLLDSIGNPQDSLKVVHVAGTNGKGSVCAFVSSILKHSNFKVGRFVSPHLVQVRDSITIDDEIMSENDWNECWAFVDSAASKLEDNMKPSNFERTTAIALHHFAKSKVDFAVIEVGMGGRTDATNVFKNTLVCAVVAIGEDHKEYLGNTLEDIASHKAGIFKKDAIAVVGRQLSSSVEAVFQKEADEVGCKKIVFVNPSQRGHSVEIITYCLDVEEGYAITTSGFRYYLPLHGDFQLYNSAISVQVALELKDTLGFSQITEHSIVEGIRNATWRGRAEWIELPAGKKVLIDGAHNPQGVEAFRKYIDDYAKKHHLENQPNTWVFASTVGKEIERNLKTLLRPGDTIFCVPFPTPDKMPWIRCWQPADLALLVTKLFAGKVTVEESPDVKAAVMGASKISDGIMVAGSLYLVSDFFRNLDEIRRGIYESHNKG